VNSSVAGLRKSPLVPGATPQALLAQRYFRRKAAWPLRRRA
jgi:hypothetical protein